MPTHRSSVLIAGLVQGSEQAAQELVDECLPLLVSVARRQLQGAQRRMEDEEDVVQSALRSFFDAAKRNKFPKLADRRQVFRLLKEMTRRKAIDIVRRQLAQKHGGGKVRGDSALDTAQNGRDGALQGAADEQPPPDVEVMLREGFRSLLDQLQDAELERLALAKMDGATNAELARELNCSQRTVERRIALIRKIWSKEGAV